MFAYCNNHPISTVDSNGARPTNAGMTDSGQTSMYYRIRYILDLPKYSRTNWEKASEEERLSILKDFIADISAAIGVHLCKVLVKDYNGSLKTRGEYDYYEDTIYINLLNLIRPGTYEAAFSTAIHEVRHVYQYECADAWCRKHIWGTEQIYIRYCMSEITAECWYNNMCDYVYPSENEALYYTQAIEADAAAFAALFFPD